MTTSSPSSSDYYKSWIAYDAIQHAAIETSYRTVWKALDCECCAEPQCWRELPILPLAAKWRSRLRWYDHVKIPPSDPQVVDNIGVKLSSDEFRLLQAHFVGHHQRIEMILICLKPSLQNISDTLKSFRDDLSNVPPGVAQEVIHECQYVSNGWKAVSELMRGVAKMDRIQYLAYVPRLAGVSGGNSPLMMPLTSKTVQVEAMFASFSDKDLAEAIRSNTVVGQIAEAFVDLIDSVSRCWMDHVVTAITTIGLTSGTKGTPNTILIDRVLKRLHDSRLLKALGSLRAPLSGIGVEMKQLHDYQTYPLADHYLDLFDDPGPEFGSHNVGFQPREYDLARQDFLQIRRRLRTSIWEHCYSKTRPALCRELGELLDVEDTSLVKFGFGSNVTEVVARLVASFSVECNLANYTVIMAQDEFVTLQRAAVSLARRGAIIQQTRSDKLADTVKGIVLVKSKETKQDAHEGTIIFVSLVNSCTQKVQSLDWVANLPPSSVVIIDVTQAVANVPLSDYGIGKLAVKPNVFVVGSLIKHARCGEGVGFLTCAISTGNLIHDPDSGWASYLTGLRTNTTVDFDKNRPLYDKGLEWSGGTPGWVEPAYVATRVLKVMPNVRTQHRYVQGLKQRFVDKVRPLLSPEQSAHAMGSDSNAVAIPLPRQPIDPLPFGLDYKVVNGATYLRCGFGVHNLPYHVDTLVATLKELAIFS